MQQRRKGKGEVEELLVCNQCTERRLECELGPSKSTSCMECCKAKAKCERPGKEKPERKRKRALVEEPEAGPSSLNRLKKLSEERSNRMAELVEVLGAGLKAITEALSKQGRLLQELMELEVDKMELMELDQWVSEDEEDEEEDEIEEGEEVEVEKELPELAKETEENGDESEEGEE